MYTKFLFALMAAILCYPLLGPARAFADEPKTIPLLMIVIEFDGGNEGNDAAPYDSELNWAETIFGKGDSLASYYLDMSQGAFTFSPADETCAFGKDGNHNKPDTEYDGVIHVTLHRPHGAWGTVNEDPNVTQKFGIVAHEAIDVASSYIDYARYDTNGDGVIATNELALCLCVAGYDASIFKKYDRTDIPVIWPHAGKFALQNDSNTAGEVSTAAFDSYIAIAEYLCPDESKPDEIYQEPLGVLDHELGHYLGLIDLYALNPDARSGLWGSYSVGPLSLMDSGTWAQMSGGESNGVLSNDGQSTGESNSVQSAGDPSDGQPAGDSNGVYDYQPTAFDAWSRYALGWVHPQIALKSGDYRLTSQLSENGYSQLLVPTPNPDEYYLLENRQPEGYDAALAHEMAEGNPYGGIVIWHIDKGSYRVYGADNAANNTDHVPAVMEQFFEESSNQYTTDWKQGRPVLNQPFYDSVACETNLGEGITEIELPLYGEIGNAPSDRVSSGIVVRFPTESAREMTVHVELGTDVAATTLRAYPLVDEVNYYLHGGNGQLARIACAALADETGAAVAVVDAKSVIGGLPAGNVTYSDVYNALPNDVNIACYTLTGEQLIELAEQSADVAARYQQVAYAIVALGRFFGIANDRLPDNEVLAPSADAILTFAGMTADVDWRGVAGARTSNQAINGTPIDLQGEYYVAMTPSVAEQYGLFASLTPNTLMLWGTPADALRSYVQTPNWEQAAQ